MGIFCLQYFLRKEKPFLLKLVLMGAVWVGAQVPCAREHGVQATSVPLTEAWAERKLKKKQRREYFCFLVFFKELAVGCGIY